MDDSLLIGAANSQPDDLNFLSTVKFKFQLRKLPAVNYFCSAVNIPGKALSNTTSQPTPLQKMPLPGHQLNYEELVIRFRVDEKLHNYRELSNWIDGLGFPKDTDQYAQLKQENTQLNQQFGGLFSDAVLHILDSDDNPIVNVIFRDAFPKSLTALEFKTGEDDTSYIEATAQFEYSYYDFQDVI